MSQPSLRLRLLAFASVSVAVALVLAGLAIGGLFLINAESSIRAGLSASLVRLVALIDPATGEPTQPMADPRYDAPAGGVYWQIENLGSGEIARSRSLWDFVLDGRAAPNDGSEHAVTIPGPAGQTLSAVIRTVRFSGTQFRVVVAENRAALDQAVTRFGWQLTVALGVLGLGLVAAAWVQVRLGLAPLEKVRAGIEALRHKPNSRLDADFPREVMPLVGEVNALLRAQNESMKFARSRASDLAHGLKTPLSVVEGVAVQLRAGGDHASAEALNEVVEEMAERIEYQLRLSQLKLRTEAHRLRSSLEAAVARSLSVIRKTPHGSALAWSFEPGPPLEVDMDRRDLMELVGVLLENAAKWARSTVRVRTVRDGTFAILTIADDGPGLDDTQIAQLGERGVRLDQTQQGSGLGVAIAREITTLNSGELRFSRAEAGGLLVTVKLPVSG